MDSGLSTGMVCRTHSPRSMVAANSRTGPDAPSRTGTSTPFVLIQDRSWSAGRFHSTTMRWWAVLRWWHSATFVTMRPDSSHPAVHPSPNNRPDSTMAGLRPILVIGRLHSSSMSLWFDHRQPKAVKRARKKKLRLAPHHFHLWFHKAVPKCWNLFNWLLT